MSNPEGWRLAKELIAKEAQEKNGFLDLERLGLTELPEEIRELGHLRSLNLGGWYITQNGGLITTKNPYDENKFLSWEAVINCIPQIQAFFISSLNIYCLKPLANLTELQSLYCFDTPIVNLSPLNSLIKLETLNCCLSQVEDLSPLSGMTQLKSLDCSYTQVSDLSPLSHMTKLHTLDCTDTRVKDLSPISGLLQLQSLYCSDTQIDDLSPLSGMIQLQTLDCSRMNSEGLSQIEGCLSITKLVSTFIRNYKNLNSLFNLKSLETLYLHANPILGVPCEILSHDYDDNCLKRLQYHYSDLEHSHEPVTDIKLIVLGNGRIGKTQIVRRLCGKDYDDQLSSTHGISVCQAYLPMNLGEPAVHLNVWDFGGQDLYHGTHKLFMQSRAIYLVIWTPATESTREYVHTGMHYRNEPLEYWLDFIKHTAGDQAPVIVVENQCDRAQDQHPQPQQIVESFQFIYYQMLHYSAKENRKREILNEAIRDAIQFLRTETVKEKVNKDQILILRVLQEIITKVTQRKHFGLAHEKQTMTQEEFTNLCAKGGDLSSAESLLRYLSLMGIVLYCPGLFNNKIIIEHQWALEAIYSVFHQEYAYQQLQQQGGRFTRSLLSLLVWGQYSEEDQELFLSMMELCGISFKIREADYKRKIEEEYLAPDLLPSWEEVEPQLADRWDQQIVKLACTWKHPFLGPQLIRKLICQIGANARENAIYWKYGVYFYDAKTQSKAIIRQIKEKIEDKGGKIILEVQGGRSQELLHTLAQWIEEFHQREGCRNYEVSPSHPIDKQSTVFLEDRVKAIDSLDGSDIRTKDQSLESVESVVQKQDSLLSIQPDYTPRVSNKPQIAVSYAWKDEKSKDPARHGRVEKFCNNIKQKGHDVLRDTTHVTLGDNLKKFMRQIGTHDRVCIILSDAYLKSPNCMYELLMIWETSADEPANFCERIRVYTVPGTKIHSIQERAEYARYWKRQRDDTRKMMEEDGLDILGPTEHANWKKIQKFANEVSEILAHIADTLQPKDFDEYFEHLIQELAQTQQQENS